MATTDYDFFSTRTEIIERAFRICGSLASGNVLSGEQSVQGIQILNDMVKSWQARRIFLWTYSLQSQALTSGTGYYAVPTNPPIIAIERAFIRDSASNDTPVGIISYEDYLDIPDKTDTGTPIQIALSHGIPPVIYCNPVPDDSTETLYYQGVAKLKDWDSASGTGDFPVRYTEALVYGLAARLSDELKLPMQERAYLRQVAETAFNEANKSDREVIDSQFVRGAFS